jgi:putative transposase
MKYNPNRHYRRSIRLKEYDYSQAGLYFITICCKNRACLFGDITDGEMVLNDAGQMVATQWLELSNRFKNIELHEYVVMPNHFHGILQIVGATLVVAQNNNEIQNKTDTQNNSETQKGQPHGIAPTGITPTGKTVGDMVGAFQSIATVEYIRGVKNNNWQPFDGKLWQRNYWEHIIRNENEYNRIAQYIINNPIKWGNDKLNEETENMVMEETTEYKSEIWMV